MAPVWTSALCPLSGLGVLLVTAAFLLLSLVGQGPGVLCLPLQSPASLEKRLLSGGITCPGVATGKLEGEKIGKFPEM